MRSGNKLSKLSENRKTERKGVRGDGLNGKRRERWDSSLKVIAEGYAAKCIWNHNPELEETGENLFVGTGPLDPRVALEKWFLGEFGSSESNIWTTTTRTTAVMKIKCVDTIHRGNYEGDRPYVEGDWCSRCPENLQNCENNLCVADTAEEEDEEEDEDKDEEMIVAHSKEEEVGVEEEMVGMEETVVVEEEVVGVEEMEEEKVVVVEEEEPVTTSSLPDSTRPASPDPGTHHPKVPSAKQEEMKKDEQVVEEACLTGMLTLRL
ncbi:hypothetical protein PAMP_011557 [Pampus punctatissimus]